MKRYTGVLQDLQGNAKVGQSVKVYVANSAVLANLFSGGAAISNPVTTDSQGAFTFEVQSGTYDFKDASGNPLQTGVQIYDGAQPGEWLNAANIPVAAPLASYGTIEGALEAVLLQTLGAGNTGIILPSGVTSAVASSWLVYQKRFSFSKTAWNGTAAGTKNFAASTGFTMPFPARSTIIQIAYVLTEAFATSGGTNTLIASVAIENSVSAAFGSAIQIQTSNVTFFSPSATSWLPGPAFLNSSCSHALASNTYLPVGGTLQFFVSTNSTGNLNLLTAGAFDMIITYGVGK